jgi:hypothetical protein
MNQISTVALFFIEDVFWLLRSGKFQFLDKPIISLIKLLYEDHTNVIEQYEEESSGEGEDFESISNDDEEEWKFFDDLDEEVISITKSERSKQKSILEFSNSPDYLRIDSIQLSK